MVVVQCVVHGLALPPEAYQLGILEHPQLVAHGRLAQLHGVGNVLHAQLIVVRRAVDDLKYTRSTRMMLVACGVLLAAHTVLRIASLAAPASVPLSKASSGSFVVFSVLLLWYTVLMVKAYNVQRTKH